MPLYLGVDVSQATLDAVIATGKQEESLPTYRNTKGSWKALGKKAMQVAEAHGETTIHLVIEPTGGYERGFVDYAYSLGWLVTVVNPFYVRRFIQGQGQRGKTDSIDALMLARYGVQKQPDPQWQMAADARELQGLLGRQDDLKKLLQAERNRLKQTKHNPRTPPAVRRSIERTIQVLQEELKALDDAVQELLGASDQLGPMATLLRTTPGVGPKVVLRLLTLFHRFYALTAGKGTPSQLVAFLGLDPQPYRSGRTVRKRPTISRMGDKAGRADLYMGATGGIRGNNPLRSFYERMIKRGKPHKVAVVACSRKLLIWAWAIFSSGQPFDPQRVLPSSQIPS
jgi:transposase